MKISYNDASIFIDFTDVKLKQSYNYKDKMNDNENECDSLPCTVNVIKCKNCHKCYEKQLSKRMYTMTDVPRPDYVTYSCRDHLNWRPIDRLNLINPCLNYVKIGLGKIETCCCSDSGASISIIS